MTWTQNYDPLGSPMLSAAVAAIPVLVLLGLLASGRVPAQWAAGAGLIAAIAVAVFVFTPEEAFASGGVDRSGWAGVVLRAAAFGAAYGLLPIGWIVLNAVFLFMLTVETGAFETVKRSVLARSDDRRVQAILIAF